MRFEKSIQSRQTLLEWLTYIFIFSICVSAWIPFSININGLNLRASQILLPVVFFVLWREKAFEKVNRSSFLLIILAIIWLGFLLFWTLFNLPYSALLKPVGHIFLLGLNLLHVVAVYLLILRSQNLQNALMAFLISAFLLIMVQIIFVIGANYGLSFPGDWLAKETTPALVNGELVSATILRFVFGGVITGCVSAAVLLLAISLYHHLGSKLPWFCWLCMPIAGVGMIIGYSRQAFISLVVGILVIAFFLLIQGFYRKLVLTLAFVCISSASALIIVDITPGGQAYQRAFLGRLDQLIQPTAYTEAGTVTDRVAIWSGMEQDTFRSPLVGNGQDSYLKYSPSINIEGSHNFPLEELHSAGPFGFMAYFLFHGFIFFWAWKILIKHGSSFAMHWLLLGLTGAYIAVICASVTNLIYWNPVYWLVIGLLLAAIRLSAFPVSPEVVS
jgi:hypothetical protein